VREPYGSAFLVCLTRSPMESAVQILRTYLQECGVVAKPAQSAASCTGHSPFQIAAPGVWAAGSQLVNVS